MRPMLACNDTILTEENYDKIRYPVVVSAKLDGRRNIIDINGNPLSRTGKPLPNLHTRKVIQEANLVGLDGELLASPSNDPNAMQAAHSAFSSVSGKPNFQFYIFDDWRRGKTQFWAHYPTLRSLSLPEWAVVLPQELVSNPYELADFVKEVTTLGFEGAVVRSPSSPYKHGRSTWKQGWMLKAKDYIYEEGTIINLKERMTNTNEAFENELGYTKRSTAKEGRVPAGTLGAFVIRDKAGREFSVGTGHLDDTQRKRFWVERDVPARSIIGRICTYKHFAQSGVRNKPRHGQFVALRDKSDM